VYLIRVIPETGRIH